ncbi:MAG: hypothetical protein HY248_05380 [Fimbriimonas ginsengisoli]|nr:hypothetical protein [Fimbriimonas ginsengisoli]
MGAAGLFSRNIDKFLENRIHYGVAATSPHTGNGAKGSELKHKAIIIALLGFAVSFALSGCGSAKEDDPGKGVKLMDTKAASNAAKARRKIDVGKGED